MIVAYHIGHNDDDAPLAGILGRPDDFVTLYDLYEVDGEIRCFATTGEAEAWLSEQNKPYAETS